MDKDTKKNICTQAVNTVLQTSMKSIGTVFIFVVSKSLQRQINWQIQLFPSNKEETVFWYNYESFCTKHNKRSKRMN